MHTGKWAILDQNFGKTPSYLFRHSTTILLHYKKLKPKKWKYELNFSNLPQFEGLRHQKPEKF